MKVEKGMYYRYKGQIGKYQKITELDRYASFTNNYNRYNDFELLNNSKFSNNIIDLIEVGDYVNGEKITRVIPEDVCGDEVLDYQHIFVGDKEIYKEDIKSIVTKERFESMEYKVVE